MALSIIILSLLVLGATASNVVFPSPRSMECTKDDQLRMLSSSFKISGATNLPILTQALARYDSYLRNIAADGGQITTIDFSIADPSEEWTNTTRYQINYANGSTSISVIAPNQFAALYALETLVQLFENAGFGCSALTVTDSPLYPHRGLLVDTSSRFFPITTLQAVIDALLMAKMNVLRLRVTGNAAVRVDTTAFPELVAGLDGFYSPADIAALVAYAKLRGVAIIPEISVPDSARGFAASPKFAFCDKSNQLFGNDTIATALINFSTEILGVFSSTHLFVGGLHGAETSGCKVNYKILMNSLATALQPLATIGGWDELLDSVATGPKVAIYTRADDATVKDLVNSSSPIVYAGPGRAFFLESDANGTFTCNKLTCLFDDLSVFSSDKTTVHGVSASFLTSNYCPTEGCVAGSAGHVPSGSIFAPRSRDDMFAKSALALIFPRAAVVGASGWNYDVKQLAAGATALSASMQARGVGVCPAGCVCTETSQCGAPYQTALGPIKNLQGGMVFAIVIFVVFLVVIVYSVVRGSGSRSGYVRVN